MKLSELEVILNNNNFPEHLEEHIISELDDEKNPFTEKRVTNEMIVSTIIHCTIILASIIYILHRKDWVNT